MYDDTFTVGDSKTVSAYLRQEGGTLRFEVLRCENTYLDVKIGL